MTLSPSDLDRLEELAAEVESGRMGPALYGTLLPGVFHALVAMARQAPRWIPVEERLPEPGTWALWWLRKRESEWAPAEVCAYWNPAAGGTETGETMIRLYSHWTPLTEPPEGM